MNRYVKPLFLRLNYIVVRRYALPPDKSWGTMMALLANIQADCDKWIEVYRQLDAEQQAILRALAVIYQDVNQTTLNRILERFNAKGVFIDSAVEPKLDGKSKSHLAFVGVIKTKQSQFRLHPLLCHSLMLETIERDELALMLEEVQVELPLSGRFDSQLRTPIQKARHIRHCLYAEQYLELESLLERSELERGMKLDEIEVIAKACFFPFDLNYLKRLPHSISSAAFNWMFNAAIQDAQPNGELIDALEQLQNTSKQAQPLVLVLAEQYLRTGELSKAKKVLVKTPDSAESLSLKGWLAFLLEDFEKSLNHFDAALALMVKGKKQKRAYLTGLPGIFYCLALLKSGYDSDSNRLNQLLGMVTHLDKDNPGVDSHKQGFLVLAEQARSFVGLARDVWFIDINSRYYEENEGLRVGILLSSLCFCWQGQEVPGEYYDKLLEYFDLAAASNQKWLAHPLARILFQSKKPYPPATAFLRNNKHQGIDLYPLIKPKERWQQVLDQLIALENQAEQNAEQNTRLVWWIYRQQFPYRVEAREQKRTKKGWTKGRVVALKRFKEELDTFEGLTRHDHHIIDQISATTKESYYSLDSYESYALSGFNALKGCIGHPLVFLADSPTQSVDIIEGEPELVISESKSGFQLYMPGIVAEDEEHEQDYNLLEQGNGRYALVKFNQKHQLIADIIGSEGLSIPKKAKRQVLKSVKSVAPFLNIHSDIAALNEVDTGGETVVADNRIYINIQPFGSGLQLECQMSPLGPRGPSQWPGAGSPLVMAQVDGKSLRTTRDLDAERSLLSDLKTLCPAFNHMTNHVLSLENLEDALACLESLQTITEPELVLQWPKGKALKLTPSVDKAGLRLSVSQQQQWFGLDGDLQVDENQVVDLKQLLQLMDKAQGRFIPLGEDKFIALTEQLKQQLDDIAALTNEGQFHGAAAPAIEQVIEGIQLDVDKSWQQQLAKLKQAFSLDVSVPTSLQANLRDYQQYGYDWAYRLAHWGTGACLADDMGLGKTVQTLALLLDRAADGPALVIAPVSVCFNWQQEALKFAPSLNVKVLSEAAISKRREWIKSAGPLDVIVCSYGLLQTESDVLTQKHWRTLIADEAQALKNPQTKRTKAALSLKGDFKLLTTGTPIENNLAELWSLFQLINPGLLGTLEQFNQKFAQPIENQNAVTTDNTGSVYKEAGLKASASLRKLITPFILRRLKNEVLTELPSRTEINLTVEHSEEEAAFYEALRRQALDNMLGKSEQNQRSSVKVLAELMRLRRACCHPALVDDSVDIPSSKLKVFDGLVEELISGHHKALVFSQFVGHLQILKQHLEQKGIAFQYLDGNTPANQRKKAVNAFQAGEGELFLISLKAGGSGLNLTAADYVIHMDPWWNPAVEDQASDRAHRMGQTRPVTVYRLITQNTIEAKILALHQQKRDLADKLLDGTDSSGSLSYEDMLDLLKP